MMNEGLAAQQSQESALEVSRAMERMARAAALVSRETGLSRVAAAIVEQVVELGAVAAHLLLADHERGELRLVAECNLPADLHPRLERLPMDAPILAARAAASGEVEFVVDIDEELPDLPLAREIARKVGARSIASGPLIAHGRLLGVLTWLWADHRPSTADRVASEAICSLFAVGLDQAMALEREVRRREQLEQAERERARLLIEIEAERRLLETVLDRVPVGIALITRDGRWRVTNPSAARLLGSADEPDRALLASLSRPDGKPLARDDLPSRRVFAGEIIDGEEYLARQADGERIPVRIDCVPILAGDGAVEAVVVVAEDIGVEKRLDRLRQEWASVLAHDLRQPLSVIKMNTDMLARETPADDENMALIRRGVSRLERMILDLSDFAKVEARRLELRRTSVDLVAVARDAAHGAATRWPPLDIEIEIRGAIPPVLGDPARIRQVFENLLSNAAKYRYPDTPLTVELEREADMVQVSVLNRGEGIPGANLAGLFDRFHRRSATPATPIRGLGLGLYITRGLVEAHGGRIWAESTPGEVTAFRFTLPVAGAE